MRGYLFEKGGDSEARTTYVFGAEEDERAALQALVRRTWDTRQESEDRSKGDALAKGFVLLQTSWFVVECLARHVQRLSITEIELVTLAYAVLNSVLYFFWWDKPLDVQCPIIVPLSAPQTVTAVVPLQAGLGDAVDAHSFYRNSNTVSEPHVPHSDNHESHPRRSRPMDHESASLLASRAEGEKEPPPPTVGQRSRRILEAAKRPFQRLAARTNLKIIVALLLEESTIPVFPLGWLFTETKDRILFVRLCLLLVSFPISLFFLVLFLVREIIEDDPFPESALVSSSTIKSYLGSLKLNVTGRETMRVAIFPASFLASLFGAVHCAAISPLWPFSTSVNRYLWSVAALHICLSPLTLSLAYLVGFIYKRTEAEAKSKRPLRMLFLGLALFTYVSLVFYIPARFILVVISLAELADLPRSAYQTIRWLEFFPHV
ncbi:hypothetical protein CC2G_007078 [Coprinopsis cinerea AmutBmut pab1-1]|nr:hypothetical protein CC2G_007078 [Coprinopsis cinerea AmutBmut pab1-1]